jgi:hypothetical protein
MRLTDALRLRPGMRVAFTGAGGKSSALAALARESHGAQPIVLTTTTRLGATQRTMADRHIILRSVEEARRLPLGADSSLLVTGPEDEAKSKLTGLADPVLSEVARRWRSKPTAHGAGGLRHRLSTSRSSRNGSISWSRSPGCLRSGSRSAKKRPTAPSGSLPFSA